MCRLVAIIFAFCVTGAFAPPNSVSERTSDVIRICGEPAPEPGPNTATDFLYPNLDSLLHDCWQPRGRERKPNPNLGIAFDDELPYRRRVVNEETIITRDVPPPNWAELPIYMVASSLQAVARDSSGHLYVYFRTWLEYIRRHEKTTGQGRKHLMLFSFPQLVMTLRPLVMPWTDDPSTYCWSVYMKNDCWHATWWNGCWGLYTMAGYPASQQPMEAFNRKWKDNFLSGYRNTLGHKEVWLAEAELGSSELLS